MADKLPKTGTKRRKDLDDNPPRFSKEDFSVNGPKECHSSRTMAPRREAPVRKGPTKEEEQWMKRQKMNWQAQQTIEPPHEHASTNNSFTTQPPSKEQRQQQQARRQAKLTHGSAANSIPPSGEASTSLPESDSALPRSRSPTPTAVASDTHTQSSTAGVTSTTQLVLRIQKPQERLEDDLRDNPGSKG